MFRSFLKTIAICFALINSIVLLPNIENCQSSLMLFTQLKEKGLLNSYNGMIDLFLNFDQSHSKVVKLLRNTIQVLKKQLKCSADAVLQKTLNEVQSLLSFIKKHKIQYEAIWFHHKLKVRYQKLFDMIEDNTDVISYIAQNKKLFDLSEIDKKFLHSFVRDIRNVAHKISQFEDYIHADNVDLKLQNYVFKIEFIKLRNTILFDRRYKQ